MLFRSGAELPDAQEADDPQRIVGVAQPGGALCMAEGDGPDDGVDQTIITENGLPQHGDGNGTAQNGRDVVNGTEQVHAGNLEVQDVCDEQRKDQLQRHGDESVLEDDYHRLQERLYRMFGTESADRKSTRLNSSHMPKSRMPPSA